ncbi:MAG: trigger factor [Acidimicrobiia bacterium]
MKSSVEPLEGNKVKLSVEVDEATFDKAVDAAFRKIAREVRIPGFRPGKAPRKLLESRLGAQVGREQALQDGLPEWYSDAVVEHDVDVIAPPEIDITGGQEVGPIAFDAVVEIRPTVEVPGYGGLRVTLDRPAVPAEEIDAQIDRMREVEATFAAVERPAVEGDTVTVDITGTLDGEPQDGLTADDYDHRVGSGAITPEVDEQLTGAKVGDILEFDATHPDPDESRSLRFRVLVKEVREKVLPALDDEWAEASTDFATVDELRADLERRMLAVRRAQSQMQLREKVGEALATLVEDDVPDALVSAEVQNRIQDMALRFQAQGISLEQWIAATGQDAQSFTEQMKDTAATAVKVDLALRAVAEAEGIEGTDEELDDELAAVAERVGSTPAEVRSRFERGGQLSAVRSDIKKRKALDWLLERVEIVDPEGQPIERDDLEIPGDAAADAGQEQDDPAGAPQIEDEA